jgi:hypothetical protein
LLPWIKRALTIVAVELVTTAAADADCFGVASVAEAAFADCSRSVAVVATVTKAVSRNRWTVGTPLIAAPPVRVAVVTVAVAVCLAVKQLGTTAIAVVTAVVAAENAAAANGGGLIAVAISPLAIAAKESTWMATADAVSLTQVPVDAVTVAVAAEKVAGKAAVFSVVVAEPGAPVTTVATSTMHR